MSEPRHPLHLEKICGYSMVSEGHFFVYCLYDGILS